MKFVHTAGLSRVSSEMALGEAIKAWLEQRPDLKPMTEALIAEAHAVERTLSAEGGAK